MRSPRGHRYGRMKLLTGPGFGDTVLAAGNGNFIFGGEGTGAQGDGQQDLFPRDHLPFQVHGADGCRCRPGAAIYAVVDPDAVLQWLDEEAAGIVTVFLIEM